jgi:hypothetical protein
MKLSTLLRIADDYYVSPPFRHVYWTLDKVAKTLIKLLFHKNVEVRRYTKRDLKKLLFNQTSKQPHETIERAFAAANWLLQAQNATPDKGVSLGYFPLDGEHNGWRPSYPETTGYIITSLISFSRYLNIENFREAALEMGNWEVIIQMPSGAVQGGPVTSPDKQTPAAFNTGMVLDGWCTLYEENSDSQLINAARRAADFLVNDINHDGYFETNGHFVSKGEIKTYTCLCAWSLFRFGNLVNEARYKNSALTVIEAAIKLQQPNGWFSHNCLGFSKAPLTHTIGYTLQAILEIGLLANRVDFIEAVRVCVDSILNKIQPNGYLPARFYSDWEPASFSSCLTGNAQIAIVCYRLYQYTSEIHYQQKADLLMSFLMELQNLESDNLGIRGAIAGSFPITGDYMSAGYPNWATKYYLDALILKDTLEQQSMVNL